MDRVLFTNIFHISNAIKKKLIHVQLIVGTLLVISISCTTHMVNRIKILQICNRKTIFDIIFERYSHSPRRNLVETDCPNWEYLERGSVQSIRPVCCLLTPKLGQSMHKILYWVQYSEREFVGLLSLRSKVMYILSLRYT